MGVWIGSLSGRSTKLVGCLTQARNGIHYGAFEGPLPVRVSTLLSCAFERHPHGNPALDYGNLISRQRPT